MGSKRAPKGGAYGANGEWYEGGKFINTIPENHKRPGTSKRGTGKQEVAPYTWEVPPTDGLSSIYRKFSGVFGNVINGVAVLRTDERLSLTLEHYGYTLEEAQKLIDLWNSGQRWM